MTIAGRDVKLDDKCRLLKALRAGGTGMAAPGVRKARSRRERRPMAQACGCSAGGRETRRSRQSQRGPASNRLLPGETISHPAPQQHRPSPGHPSHTSLVPVREGAIPI